MTIAISQFHLCVFVGCFSSVRMKHNYSDRGSIQTHHEYYPRSLSFVLVSLDIFLYTVFHDSKPSSENTFIPLPSLYLIINSTG